MPGQKTKRPCPTKNCWDRIGNPAVPPGLTCTMHVHSCILHMLVFLYRGPALSHILRIHGKNPFQLALGSPFNLICNAAIPPPAALWRYREKIYLLFFNGFVYHNPCENKCQEYFENFILFSKKSKSRGRQRTVPCIPLRNFFSEQDDARCVIIQSRGAILGP